MCQIFAITVQLNRTPDLTPCLTLLSSNDSWGSLVEIWNWITFSPFSHFLCPLSAESLAMLVMILIWQYRICLAIWNIASQSTKPAQWMVDCKWKEDVFITTYHFLSSLHKYFIMTSCDISYSYEPHIPIGWIGVHFDCFHSNVLPFFVSLLIWLAKDFAVLLNLIRF